MVALVGIHVLPDLHLTVYRMIQDSYSPSVLEHRLTLVVL